MVGAMLTEFIRRTLRSGVVRIDEEMHGYVAEKVDATIADRTPAMERVAAEVAESTARFAASDGRDEGLVSCAEISCDHRHDAPRAWLLSRPAPGGDRWPRALLEFTSAVVDPSSGNSRVEYREDHWYTRLFDRDVRSSQPV